MALISLAAASSCVCVCVCVPSGGSFDTRDNDGLYIHYYNNYSIMYDFVIYHYYYVICVPYYHIISSCS